MELVVGRTREVLADSHFALATSGTVTLEVAHFGVPMVIFYRAGRLLYNLLGRWLLQTPHLSLVNILAGRRLVPEIMPWHGNVRQITDAVMDVMDDYGWLCQTRRDLVAMMDRLRAARPARPAKTRPTSPWARSDSEPYCPAGEEAGGGGGVGRGKGVTSFAGSGTGLGGGAM